MRALHTFALFVVVTLPGCDSKKEFADFDNEEEVNGFRVSRNEMVLKSLEQRRRKSPSSWQSPGKTIVTSWKKTLLTPTVASTIRNFSPTTRPWRICQRACRGRTVLISPSWGLHEPKKEEPSTRISRGSPFRLRFVQLERMRITASGLSTGTTSKWLSFPCIPTRWKLSRVSLIVGR